MNNYNETVLELLKEYVEAEIAIIFEYSGDFSKALKELKNHTLKYIEKLNISHDDSVPILSKIERDIERYSGDSWK